MTAFATESQDSTPSLQLSPTAGYYIRKLLRQQGVASPVDPTADLGQLLRNQYPEGSILTKAIAKLERLAQYHQVLSSQGNRHAAELSQTEQEIIRILDRPLTLSDTREIDPLASPAVALSEGLSTDHFSVEPSSDAQQDQLIAAPLAPPVPQVLHISEHEDERESTDLFAALLRSRNYQVQHLCAPSESSPLALPAGLTPDVVVVDLKMSERGVELCRLLRQQPEFSHLPLILVSSLHSVSDRLKAIKLGINDYLTQPVQPEEMLVRIENHLQVQERFQQLTEQIQQLQNQLIQSQNGTSPLLTQAVLDQHGDYLLFIDRKNQIVHANEAASQRLGYSRAELTSTSMDSLDVRLAPQDWTTIWEHLQIHQTLSLNSAHVTKAGETLDVQLDLQYLEVNQQAYSYLCAKAA